MAKSKKKASKKASKSTTTSTTTTVKKVVTNPGTSESNPQEIDEHAARELVLWIDNTEPLYRQWQAIVKNMWRHKAKGRYDHERAIDGFMYLVDAAAKDYTKKFGAAGDRIDVMFNKATRRHAAEEYAQSFEENDRDEVYYMPQAAKNPSHRKSNAEWHGQILDMVAESEGIDSDVYIEMTSDLEEAIEKYESRLHDALEDVIQKYPPKNDQDINDVLGADADYNVFMTLNGEGVGIWDGRWKHLWNDDDLENVQKLLMKKLRDVADDTGSGWLNDAFRDAVYAADREENPSSSSHMTAVAARLARGEV